MTTMILSTIVKVYCGPSFYEPEKKILSLIKSSPMTVMQQRDDNGEYLLHHACDHCIDYDTVIIMLLERFPIAAQQLNDKGSLPLHIACSSWKSSENVLMKLIEVFPEAAFIKSNEGGGFPLHLSCQLNPSVKVIRKLIELNPMALQEKDDDGGCYPILCAFGLFHRITYDQMAEIGKEIMKEIFQLLFDADPSAMERTNDGHSALHFCCFFGVDNILEYMVQHSTKGQINRRNVRGMTPLHDACLDKYDKGVEELLKHPDINPNATDNFNETPLHSVFYYEDTFTVLRICDIVKKLLDHPLIIIDQKNNDNKTPLDLIAEEIKR